MFPTQEKKWFANGLPSKECCEAMLLSQCSSEESIKMTNYYFCYTAQIKCGGQNGFCVCSSDKTANT